MKQLDFLLVGFCKSGTSSFDVVLRQDKRIMLSEIKETQYISNHGNMDIDRFWNIYYPNYKKNKCIGGREQTYCFHAKKIKETFGGNIKLIFMMRNPVKANYSQFKMRLRGQGNSEIDKLYRKYSADNLPEMYEHYVNALIKDKRNLRDDFQYDKWIKEYLKYFRLEQMHFILFEDFIAEPQRVINETQEFLGLTPRRIGGVKKENSDSGISKNMICRLINKRISLWVNKWNNYPRIRNKLINLRNKIYQYTLVVNNKSMNRKTEEILKDHYSHTIMYIEKILHRDLSNLW